MTHIRPAQPTEWKQLQDLNNEVFLDNAQYDPDIIKDWAHSPAGEKYFRELVNDSKALCLVAENKDGQLVGYIAASEREFDYRQSKYFEINNMGVIPEYRSQGIGTLLIEKCLTWAKERGYQKAIVDSYFANTGAIAFYKKSGFEPIAMELERKI